MTDREILSSLAREYMEAAADPVNDERRKRAYLTNGLTPTRPLVWVDEVPWHEMNWEGEMTLTCQGEAARGMEHFFRRSLFQWRHFQADMILEPFFPVPMIVRSTGNGLDVEEKIVRTDQMNHIVSHQYADQLDSMEKLSRIRLPVLTRDREAEEKNLSFAGDMLSGVMPARLCGQYMAYVPWDDVSRYRGMSALLMDLLVEPELMHATIQKLVECYTAQADQMEQLGVFTSRVPKLHCTPGYSHELEDEERAHGPTARCTWFRAAAQPLGQVSPALHDEFEVEYLLPLASRFGLTYYGCCESLYDRLDIIKKIPNLRKVGVTPWSRVEASAEGLGGGYVFARKPNPALVMRNLDEDAVRKETRETIEACLRHGCPYEFALKDISTVSYKPQNLSRWVRIVEETIDAYY